MKKILTLIAAIATAATLTSCHYIKPGIYETVGTAASATTFNINGEIFEIYADRLQQSETYIIILSDNGTPFNIYDDEILNYCDMEVYELMKFEKELN
jgi:hypothetical protein